jgi:hypothetical protein
MFLQPCGFDIYGTLSPRSLSLRVMSREDGSNDLLALLLARSLTVMYSDSLLQFDTEAGKTVAAT